MGLVSDQLLAKAETCLTRTVASICSSPNTNGDDRNANVPFTFSSLKCKSYDDTFSSPKCKPYNGRFEEQGAEKKEEK